MAHEASQKEKHHFWFLTEAGLKTWKAKRKEILGDFLTALPYLPFLGGLFVEDVRPKFGDTVEFNSPLSKDLECFVFPFEDDYLKPRRDLFKETWLVGSSACTYRDSYDLAVKTFLLIAKLHLEEDLLLGSTESVAEWGEAAELVKRGVGPNLAHRVDPYDALDRKIYLAQDAKGRPLLFETVRQSKMEAENLLNDYVKKLEAQGKALSRRSFDPPFVVQKEARPHFDTLMIEGVVKAEGVDLWLYEV